jgi:hypothetical protein
VALAKETVRESYEADESSRDETADDADYTDAHYTDAQRLGPSGLLLFIRAIRVHLNSILPASGNELSPL